MQTNSKPASIVKKWIPLDIGGGLVAYGKLQFDTEEQCQDYIDGLDYLGCMLTATEVEVNQEPLTQRGTDTWEKIRAVYESKGITYFHMSLMPGFLAMSMDDRVQFIFDMLSIDHSKLEEATNIDT